MGKQDELKRNFGGNIAASMGRTPLRGASPPGETSPGLTVTRRNDVITIPADLVDPDPNQPREEFGEEELEQLATSIAEQGQLQTVVVYKEGERYMLVCGERRWRAVKKKGLPTINATLLKEKPDELTRVILQHNENKQRKAFTRNEEAKVYRTLMERFAMSRADVARTLAIAEADVSRALAIDEKLPEDIKEKVSSGGIALTVAYEITKVCDPDHQRELAEMAEQGATRAEIIETAKSMREVAPRKRPDRRKPDRGTAPVEITLADSHSKVMISGPAASTPETRLAALREAEAAIKSGLAEQGGNTQAA